MLRSFFTTAFCLLIYIVKAQQVADLEENKPYENNGLEYGYYITNESSKEVKGEDYDRYEVNLYVTNKTGCIKIIPLRMNGNNADQQEITIAEFNCKNATGKRLTAKSGKVSAKPWYTTVKFYDEKSSDKNKYRLVNAQAGFAIRSGETITNRIIVIVPKGQRPVITCRTVYLPEL